MSEAKLTPAHGSAWTQSGGVMCEAELLEELIQLRLERPGETREAALQWALDMRRHYTPNTDSQTSSRISKPTSD